MRKVIVWALLALFCVSCGTSSSGDIDYNFIPVQQGKRYGYVNPEGKYVINPQFDDATLFIEGIARIKKDGKYGYIRKDGSYICQPIYEKATVFQEGMAWVVKEKGAPTAIDTDGKEIFTAKDVYSVSCYSEGLARFSQRTDDDGRIKYGYMNRDGKVVIKPIYMQATSFGQNLAAVADKGDLFGYINNKGELKINYQFEKARKFDKQGRAIVKADNEERGYGVINKKGEYVIQPQFTYMTADGDFFLIKMERGGDYGYCNTEGKLIINPQFKFAAPFNGSKLAPVQIGDLFGYIDRKGNLQITPQFHGAAPFCGEYALVYFDEKIGIIDQEGKYKANPQFKDISDDFLLEGEDICETSFAKVYTQYINIEKIVERLKYFLNNKRIDSISFPPSVNETLKRYGLTEKAVPVYNDWKILLGYWEGNLNVELALNGFFYKEVSDGWWGTKRVLDLNAKADKVQLQIYLSELVRGRAAEVAANLSEALKNGYEGYRFNIASDGINKITIDISR